MNYDIKKRISIIVILFLIFSFTIQTAYGTDDTYNNNELIVRFKNDVSNKFKAMNEAHDSIGAKVKKNFTIVKGMSVVELKSGMSIEEGIKLYRKNPNVEYVEPNYIYSIEKDNLKEIDEVSIDSLNYNYNYLWGVENNGQYIQGYPGIVSADINAVEAWEKETGNKDVTIAVIDTGIDYTHPDLVDNMWADSQGYYGKDFVNNDNDPMDDQRHGTHVAGIIGGYNKNLNLPVGVMNDASIMALKVLNQDGFGTTTDIIEAIEYAENNGVDIINFSFSGPYDSQSLKDAIQNTDALFIVSAGNESNDNDYIPSYPSNYNLPNLISVAATNNRDELAGFSNYGYNSVDVAAPGEFILSTYLYGDYIFLSGTSMAAPYVSGLAGLMLSYNNELSTEDMVDIIKGSVDKIPSFSTKLETGGRIDAKKALDLAEQYFDTNVLTSVVALVEGTYVVVNLEEYNIAFQEGEGNQIYDYLSKSHSITIKSVGSNNKYIDINDFALLYALHGEKKSIDKAQALGYQEIKDYQVLNGFDENGNPILESIE